jgi:phospholipid transport system substrate-binding protein
MKPVLFAVLLLAGAPGLTSAGPLVDLLKSRQVKVDAVLKASPGDLSPADKKNLEDALTASVDFLEMARATLGTEWEKRSDAEQKEFAQLFEEMLRASLLRRVDVHRVDRVDYAAETLEDATGSVRSTRHVKGATTVVDYSFRKTGADWNIVDYAVDGVSTVRNYRSQFTKILTKNGFESLVARLRKRTAEIQAER